MRARWPCPALLLLALLWGCAREGEAPRPHLIHRHATAESLLGNHASALPLLEPANPVYRSWLEANAR
jgi:hypothetical protein